MERGDYDAIIIGGSFAGLSTAYFTGAENILILERKKRIGDHQVSTCGAPVHWIQKLGADKSILKKFHHVTIHSPKDRKVRIDLPMPYCTFDYQVFCESVSKQLNGVKILTDSRVTGVENGDIKRVRCGDEEYSSQIIVDASGWRAVVASALRPGKQVTPPSIFGMETEAEYFDTDSIHFYFGKKFIPGGYAWIFPIADNKARVGIGTIKKIDFEDYNRNFRKFLDIEKYKHDHHGGFIPCHGLLEPVVEGAFMVGDSGGHVLPGTAEGIRKTFVYGEMCGGFISEVIKGEMSHNEALERYKEGVYRARKFYDTMAFIQNITYWAPDWAWEKAIEKISSDKTISQRLLSAYMEERVNHSRLRLVMRVLKSLLK